MAILTVQELPANGLDLGTLTFAAASTSGDTFANTGREILIFSFDAVPVRDPRIVTVAGSDAGRTITQSIVSTLNTLSAAGPFKTRNFNSGGSVTVKYDFNGTIITTEDATDINVAVVRFTLG